MFHIPLNTDEYSPRIYFLQSLGRNRNSKGCADAVTSKDLAFDTSLLLMHTYPYSYTVCEYVLERELLCGVSEHGLVWSSSVFADKSLWVTEWDLLMISPAPPISNSLSFLSIIACALWLNYHVLTILSFWKLTVTVPKDSLQLQSPNETLTDTHTHKKHDVEYFTVTHHNIIQRCVYNNYSSNILCCSYSSLTMSPYTSSFSSHPVSLTFPIFKPKHMRSGKQWKIVKDPLDFVAEGHQNGSGQSF